MRTKTINRNVWEHYTDSEGYGYLIDWDGLKREINNLKTKCSIPTILAYIYDLYQSYQISEEVEIQLYEFVDPTDEYNDVSEYWWTMDTEDNPLKRYCS